MTSEVKMPKATQGFNVWIRSKGNRREDERKEDESAGQGARTGPK